MSRTVFLKKKTIVYNNHNPPTTTTITIDNLTHLEGDLVIKI